MPLKEGLLLYYLSICIICLKIKTRCREHVVCQKAFINLHGITRGRVVGVANRSISSITSPPDRRGKHSTRPNKIPDSIREQVKDHIKSFPSNESHYSRKHTSHKYLASELNVVIMHDLYLQKYEPHVYERKSAGEKVKPQISYDYYRNVFNTCFNLSFGRPRSDTCSKCDELNIKIQAAENDDKKKSLEAELNIHHRKAERFYDEIKTDTIRSKEDPTFEVVTFDFQQNLPLPHLPVNDIFRGCRRQPLYCFHFDFQYVTLLQ